MANFYDNWLSMWDNLNKEKKKARKVIYPEELKWIRTKQDYKVALLAAPENGFRTWGTCTMISEMPAGWNTGKHAHGEEAIYIVSGKGFSVINDQKYGWGEGSCIRIPFGAVHQHFNTGNSPVLYYSALAPHLEYLCNLAKFEQLEECSEIKKIPDGPEVEFDKQGRKLVLHASEAKVTYARERPKEAPVTEFIKSHPKEMFIPVGDPTKGTQSIHLMGSRPDFVGEEIEMTHIFVYKKGMYSQDHAHMEAILYVLDGEGYSMVGGEKVPWKKGTCYHVQGPQTRHQHFANTDAKLIRTHFGIRSMFFQPIAKERFPYLFFGPGSEAGASG